MIRAMRLDDAVDEYVLLRRLRDSSAYQLRRSVALYAAWLGRPPTLADFTGPEVSHWLQALETTHAQRTVAGHRANLLCLWREAADQNAVDPPWKIRRVPRPEPCPVSWTADELRRLRAACASAQGTLDNGVPAGLYLVTVLDVAYDTGLRRSDLWTLRRDQVREDGSVVLRQHKTGWTCTPRMRQRTLEEWRQLPGDTPLAWPGANWRGFYRLWRRVLGAAGIRRGCLQQIRRTGASHLAIDHPEAVQRYLGHRTAEMQRYYVDESIARPVAIEPPEL